MVLEEFLAEWQNAADCVAVHTSGSTGKPKAMLVEKRRMTALARVQCDFLGLRRGHVAMLCMQLDYIGAKMVVVRCIERGMRLVAVQPSGHPLADREAVMIDFSQRPWRIVPLCSWTEAGAPDFAAMVPMQVYNTLGDAAETQWLRRVGHLIIGGGAIDDALALRLCDFPNPVWSTYGMTETLSHIALRRINGAAGSSWYVPFEGVAVSASADGCLVVDAPMVHDGLLLTNDRVEITRLPDVQGGKVAFRVLGRKDNVIVSGGVKIQIEEVERRLRPLLAAPFMVTKLADEKFGEAVVLLTEDADVAAVAGICAAALPKYWQPRAIFPVSRVPVTPNGKPARAEAALLAARLQSGR